MVRCVVCCARDVWDEGIWVGIVSKVLVLGFLSVSIR